MRVRDADHESVVAGFVTPTAHWRPDAPRTGYLPPASRRRPSLLHRDGRAVYDEARRRSITNASSTSSQPPGRSRPGGIGAASPPAVREDPDSPAGEPSTAMRRGKRASERATVLADERACRLPQSSRRPSSAGHSSDTDPRTRRCTEDAAARVRARRARRLSRLWPRVPRLRAPSLRRLPRCSRASRAGAAA